jgi:hypothetical protein
MTNLIGTGKIGGISGFAGKNSVNVGLIIQSIPNSNNFYFSIINDTGKHISSYPISQKKVRKIIMNDFWILKDRNFN